MKILLVKTSSMGDVVHTLTALREASIQRPDLHIDWLVEESFSDIANIAKQQGDVVNVIPIHFRQWRKRKPFGIFFNPDIRQLKQKLIQNQYDWVLDAQGLLKSGFLAHLASVPVRGFDKHSVRERGAAYLYQHGFAVDKNQHAIERLRQLFAQAFNYPLLKRPPVLSSRQSSDTGKVSKPKVSQQIVLLHGTTWDNKAYPTAQWHELASKLSQRGCRVLIPHHGEREFHVATAISARLDNVSVLPEQRLSELLHTLTTADAVVSVDTGLAHLAVYLGIPTVMLFGPTRPELTGGIGAHAVNLVGQANDTATMKRKSYSEKHFSESMQAIAVNAILQALSQVIPHWGD